MKQYLLDWLHKAVADGVTLRIESDCICTYDDTTGQRECYLTYYGYGEENFERYPDTFKVKRRLPFANSGDIGKEDAILFILRVKEVKNVIVSSDQVKFNGLTITARQSVFK